MVRVVLPCFPLPFHLFWRRKTSRDFTSPLWLGSLWQRGCAARGASTGSSTRAGPGARTRPCLFKTSCKAMTCTLLLGHVYGCCGEAIPLCKTCPSLEPAHRFLLFFLPGFSLNVCLFSASYMMSFPTPFFPLEQYFCAQSLWTGCLFLQILKSLQRMEEAILFLLGFFLFLPSLISPSCFSKAESPFATCIPPLASLSLFSSVGCVV